MARQTYSYEYASGTCSSLGYLYNRMLLPLTYLLHGAESFLSS